MYDELKLIDVTIDDCYRATLRFLRCVIGEKRVQSLSGYTEKQHLVKRILIKAMLCLLGICFLLIGVAIYLLLGGTI